MGGGGHIRQEVEGLERGGEGQKEGGGGDVREVGTQLFRSSVQRYTSSRCCFRNCLLAFSLASQQVPRIRRVCPADLLGQGRRQNLFRRVQSVGLRLGRSLGWGAGAGRDRPETAQRPRQSVR